MKKIFLVFAILTFTLFVNYQGFSQEEDLELTRAKFRDLDKSPHDITYLKIDKTPVVKVLYGRPQKKDREIFGGIVSFDKIWRTGANEATEITFYKNVVFAGKKLKAGTYVLHTIPGKKEWTIILNSNLNVWGAYQYKEDADVLRVTVPVSVGKKSLEAFSIAFKRGKNKVMVLGWDLTRVEIPLSF